MAQDKVFADGLSAKEVSTQYGKITKLSIKSEDFIKFLEANTNDQGWCSVDLLEKKDKVEGKATHYGVLNTYTPKQQNLQPVEDDGDLNTLPF